MQANKWLKKMSENQLGAGRVLVLKPTTDPKQMASKLELALSLGQTVIFEDANETFDPMLDPILSKQFKKEGNDWLIKFGESFKPFDLQFQFYVTTKIARPHYSPEICVKVTMINFVVTPDGLLDQVTSVILQIEDQKKYDMREKNISQKADSDKKIKEL